jgi:hypothetical protein
MKVLVVMPQREGEVPTFNRGPAVTESLAAKE